MRKTLVLFAVLLAPGLAAAPIPVPAPAPDKLDPAARAAAAKGFAQQLLHVVEQVAEQYVRPVSREDLVHAALVGLYEAARKPVPRDLKARIQRNATRSISTEWGPLPVPPPGSDDPLLGIVREAHRQVAAAESLQGQNALLVCSQGMARALDPYSAVVTAEEQQRALGLDAECDGVGLEVKPTGTIEIVHLGGPAQRAGLRPGDVITHLDGKAFASAPADLREVVRNRRPPVGLAPLVPSEKDLVPEAELAPVRVTFRRPAEKKARTAVLQPTRFRPETVLGVRRHADGCWDYWFDKKKRIAHVRIATLARGTADELRAVLAELSEVKLNGLVLDLRWCPGGYLNEAVDVAEMFLGEGTVATVKSRAREATVYRSTNYGKFRGFPLVVLVNGETLGGAELIAAALQDHGRAVVVGQRTRGKASVQTPLALGPPGVALKLTSGTFVRPSGKNLHRFPASKIDDEWGVVPDEGGELRLSADLGKQLRQWWLDLSLRPGASRERLTLDDPGADPQRQTALGALREPPGRKVRAQAR